MKTKIFAGITMIGLLVLMQTACSKSSDSATPNQNQNPNTTDTTKTTMDGTWASGPNFTDYTLYMPTAKTYNISNAGVNYENGTYTYNDSVLTFNVLKSSWGCMGKQGSYKYKITGKIMKLTKSYDLCTNRLPILALTWTKQ